MRKIYPFKFLDSYNRNDKNIFYGRDEEIAALYKMVFESSILLLYGPSGAGKTSLIQCGLANEFQPYDWLALSVRRGNNLIASLDSMLCQWTENEFIFNPKQADNYTLDNLEEKIEAIYTHDFRPIYLIFDQFEELYVLGSKEEQQAFIQVIKRLLQIDQPLKIIISMREEYLGYLYEFEKEVPQLLRKKLRVDPMNLKKVTDVIAGVTGEHTNIELSKKDLHTFSEKVFNILRGKDKAGNALKKRTIKLPYLQVLMDKLYLDTTQDKTRTATAHFTMDTLAKVENIDNVLRDFLNTQVQEIKDFLYPTFPMLTEDIIWSFLSPFATLDGTKQPVFETMLALREKQLLKDSPIKTALTPELLKAFTNTRIIKKREENGLYYEVTHDALAQQINNKRSDDEIARMEVERLLKSQAAISEDAQEPFSEKQMSFIEPYLSQLVPKHKRNEKPIFVVMQNNKPKKLKRTP